MRRRNWGLLAIRAGTALAVAGFALMCVFTLRGCKSRERRILVQERRHANGPTGSPDGKMIAWGDDQGTCVANLDNVDSPRIVGPSRDGPSFSPDGNWIGMTVGTYVSDSHVELVPVTGRPARKVPNTDGAVQVRFDSSGRILVLREFWRRGGFGEPTRGLWEYNADGSGGRELISESQFSDPLGQPR